MKKLLLTLTAVAGLTLASNAQEFGFQKTDLIVEGNLGFNTNDNKNTEIKQNSFNFSPKVGYFLTDKFALGLYGTVENAKKEAYGTIESEETENAFEIGAFGRYYFLELGERFKTYTEVAAGYRGSDSETTVAGVKNDGVKYNGFGANAGIGASYFLTEKIAVNFAFANVIGFNTTKADIDNAESVSNFGLNVNRFNNFFDAATFGLTFKF